MAIVDWVKHTLPMKLKDGKRHLFPTLASLVYLNDGKTTLTDEQGLLHADKADDSFKLGGKPPEYYIQPVNLLDNSWWKNPKEIVNQRGATSGAAWTYVIDRWSGYEYDTSLQMDNDGLTLLDSTYLIQHVPMHKFTIGKWYTIALYFADGTVDVGSGCINQSHLEGYQDIIVSQALSCVISCRGSNEFLDFGILCRNKAIRACALYEGQYTAETLPPYVPKGYVAELAECQRYYYRVHGNPYGVVGHAIAKGDTTVSVVATIPEMKEINMQRPTFGYGGTFHFSTINSFYQVEDIYADMWTVTNGAVSLNVTIVNDGTPGQGEPGTLQFGEDADAYIDFSCDL